MIGKLHYSSQLSLFIQHRVHGVTSSLASIGQCRQETKLLGVSDNLQGSNDGARDNMQTITDNRNLWRLSVAYCRDS